jgi:hypothetical protein
MQFSITLQVQARQASLQMTFLNLPRPLVTPPTMFATAHHHQLGLATHMVVHLPLDHPIAR